MFAIKFNIFHVMDSIFCLFILNNNDDEDVDGMALLSSGDDVELKNVRAR